VTPRFAHIALNCTDLTAAESFYTTWFGFSRSRVFELPDTTVVFLTNGVVQLELFHTPGIVGSTEADGQQTPDSVDAGMADGPHTPGQIRHLAFQVDDVQGFLDRVAGRIPVTLGPLAFDSFIPGWRSAWLRAPDNVIIEVSQGYQDR
jgi:glyoxylase I family protein